tara:strand:- start:6216 stop:10859 length:4644 start_codon:yes stop_codon:yes gene_type:complete
MLKGMVSSIATGLASGGTVDGDLVITGDFKVEGAGSFAFDEIVEGTMQIIGDLSLEETSSSSGILKFKDTDQALLGQIGLARTTNDIATGSANLDLVSRLEFNGKFMWSQQNTNRMTLTSTGLGIGTTSPATQLHLNGTDPLARFQVSSGNNFGGIEFYNNSGALASKIGNFGHTQNLYFNVQGNDNAIFHSTGNKFFKDIEIENQFPKVIFDDTQGGAMQIASNAGDIRISQNASGDTPTTDTIYVTNDGKVGIGLSASSPPSHPLHINSSVSNGQLMQLHNTNNADGTFIKFTGANSTSEDWQLGAGVTGFSIYSITDSAFRFIVGNDGNVGIGSLSAPTHKLHALSTDNKAFLLDRNTNNNPTSLNEFSSFYSLSIKNRASGTYLNFGGDSTHTSLQATDGAGSATAKNIVLNPYGGNVGIGTSSPSQLLHIEGSSFPTALIKGGSSGSVLRLQGANNDSVVFNDNTADKWFLRYQPGVDKIDFFNAGLSSSALTILDSNNKIGIGTDSPNTSVEISDTDAKLRLVSERHNTDTGATNNFTQFGYDSSGDRPFIISNQANTPIHFKVNAGSIRFVIDDNSRISLSNNGGSSSTIFGRNAGNNLNSDTIGNNLYGESTGNAYTTGSRNTHFGHNNARYNVTGTKNVSMGYEALLGSSGNSHSNNTAVGYQTLKATTTASSNTALGIFAGLNLTDGSFNVLLGASAGENLDTNTNHNVMVGYQSGEHADGATVASVRNAYVGYQSGRYLDDGQDNVAIGYQSMYSNSSEGNNALNNVAVGKNSLYSVTTGSFNTALGKDSGDSITTGEKNVFVGTDSGQNMVTNSNSTFVGYEAGYNAQSSNSTSIGYQSLYKSTGNDNSALGVDSMVENTSGVNNVGLGKSALRNNQTGNYNTAVGSNALLGTASNSHSNNVAVGYKSLHVVETCSENVAIGVESMQLATTGNKNTAMGYQSLRLNATGAHNTAIGHEAMEGVSGNSHSHNTAIGVASLKSITTGNDNVGVGNYTLDALTIGHSNVAVGKSALSLEVEGYGITAMGFGAFSNANRNGGSATGSAILNPQVGIGYIAGASTTTGNTNTFIGAYSAFSNTTGSRNVVLGYSALYTPTTANDCVALGNDAMGHAQAGQAYSGVVAIGKDAVKGNSSSTTTAINGTVGIGMDALTALTSGSSNVAIGFESGKLLTTGHSNTFLGYESAQSFDSGESNMTAIGRNSMGSANNDSSANCVAVGVNALEGGTGVITNSIAIGKDAMSSTNVRNVDASIAIGLNAMDSTCGGGVVDCIAIGRDSMHHASNQLSGVSDSIGIGKNSLQALTTGDGNIALGSSSCSSMTTGTYNVAMGFEALRDQSTASFNTAIGTNALSNSEAENNVGIGKSAGDVIVTGLNNTIIGTGSDPSANNATNQTVIGFAVTGIVDNSVVLGNAAVTKVYMSSDGDAEIYANGTINTSDRRLKENIKDSDLGLEFVNKLRPVKYNYIKDKHDGKTKYGIIAQEVQEVLKESNNEDFAGIKDSDEYLGADYIQFVAPLIKAVQELSAEVNELKQQLKDK